MIHKHTCRHQQNTRRHTNRTLESNWELATSAMLVASKLPRYRKANSKSSEADLLTLLEPPAVFFDSAEEANFLVSYVSMFTLNLESSNFLAEFTVSPNTWSISATFQDLWRPSKVANRDWVHSLYFYLLIHKLTQIRLMRRGNANYLAFICISNVSQRRWVNFFIFIFFFFLIILTLDISPDIRRCLEVLINNVSSSSYDENV